MKRRAKKKEEVGFEKLTDDEVSMLVYYLRLEGFSENVANATGTLARDANDWTDIKEVFFDLSEIGETKLSELVETIPFREQLVDLLRKEEELVRIRKEESSREDDDDDTAWNTEGKEMLKDGKEAVLIPETKSLRNATGEYENEFERKKMDERLIVFDKLKLTGIEHVPRLVVEPERIETSFKVIEQKEMMRLSRNTLKLEAENIQDMKSGFLDLVKFIGKSKTSGNFIAKEMYTQLLQAEQNPGRVEMKKMDINAKKIILNGKENIEVTVSYLADVGGEEIENEEKIIWTMEDAAKARHEYLAKKILGTEEDDLRKLFPKAGIKNKATPDMVLIDNKSGVVLICEMTTRLSEGGVASAVVEKQKYHDELSKIAAAYQDFIVLYGIIVISPRTVSLPFKIQQSLVDTLNLWFQIARGIEINLVHSGLISLQEEEDELRIRLSMNEEQRKWCEGNMKVETDARNGVLEGVFKYLLEKKKMDKATGDRLMRWVKARTEYARDTKNSRLEQSPGLDSKTKEELEESELDVKQNVKRLPSIVEGMKKIILKQMKQEEKMSNLEIANTSPQGLYHTNAKGFVTKWLDAAWELDSLVDKGLRVYDQYKNDMQDATEELDEEAEDETITMKEIIKAEKEWNKIPANCEATEERKPINQIMLLPIAKRDTSDLSEEENDKIKRMLDLVEGSDNTIKGQKESDELEGKVLLSVWKKAFASGKWKEKAAKRESKDDFMSRLLEDTKNKTLEEYIKESELNLAKGVFGNNVEKMSESELEEAAMKARSQIEKLKHKYSEVNSKISSAIANGVDDQKVDEMQSYLGKLITSLESLGEDVASEKKLKLERGGHLRREIKLSEEEEEILGRKGWNGKKLNKKIREGEIPEKPKKLKKLFLKPDTDEKESYLKDIDDAIDSDDWYSYYESLGWDVMDTSARLLVDKASEIIGGYKTETFTKSLIETKIGVSLCINSLMKHEDSISMNTYLRRNEGILKKLSRGLYVLTRSAGPTKQVYYTTLVFKKYFSMLSGPFVQPIFEDDNIMIFPLICHGRHTISALESSEVYMTLPIYWMQIFGSMPEFTELWKLDKKMITLKEEEKGEVLKVKTKINDLIFSRLRENKLVRTHTNFSIMLLLEDDANLSADALQLRHWFSEAMKGNGLPLNMLKNRTKFSFKCWCRLNAWLLNRVIIASKIMAENPPRYMRQETDDAILDEDEEGEKTGEVNTFTKDNVMGLISPISLSEVHSFKAAISISYMGCLFNKDKGEETVGFVKMFNKIMTQEILFEETRIEYTGFLDHANTERKEIKEDKKEEVETEGDEKSKKRVVNEESITKEHEFDASWACEIGRKIKKVIQTKRGLKGRQEYESYLRRQFYRHVRKARIDTLASLKASANMDYPKKRLEEGGFQNVTAMTKEEGVNYNKRNKVIYEITRLLSLDQVDIYPLTTHAKLSDLIDKQCGVLCNLFKKQQLGGVREIFVLDILSRLEVLYLESWSRMICEELEIEMLTKGDYKYVVSKEHWESVNAKVNDNNYKLSGHDSGDSETWCQKFIMTCFGRVLKELCPGDIFSRITHCLNAVANKKLELPIKLLNLFRKYKHDKTKKSFYGSPCDRLKEEFNGDESERQLLLNMNGIFLKNVSNMMQGILHYTSSMVHAGHLLLCQELEKKFISQFCEVRNRMANKRAEEAKGKDDLVTTKPVIKIDLVNSPRVSSDDFSWQRTLIGRGLTMQKMEAKTKYHLFRCLLLQLSYATARTYRRFCAKVSRAKSVLCCLNGIIEFNSIWEIWNNVCSVPIKFLYAALRTKPMTMMIARQEVAANLLKQCSENGVSNFLCSMIQDMQARIHYACLGSRVDNTFEDYSDLLLKNPHPALGFFCLQPPLSAGLLGFDYSHYLSLRNNRRSLEIEKILISQTDPEMSDSGKASVSVILTLGNLSKYQTFLDLMKKIGMVKDDWRQHGNDNPLVMIEPIKTKDDAKFQINKKVLTGSVSESFSFKSANKLYASASYILKTKCITTKMVYTNKLSKKTKVSLMTLLCLINNTKLDSLPTFEETESEEKFKKEETMDKLMKTRMLLAEKAEIRRKELEILKEDIDRRTMEDRRLSDRDDFVFNYLFPVRRFYDAVTESIRVLESNKIESCSKFIAEMTTKLTKITLPITMSPTSVSVVDCVKYFWHGIRRHKVTALTNAWDVYKKVFSWLKDDAKSSMEAGAFKDAVTMYDFLSRQTSREKTIKLLAPFKLRTNPLMMIESAMSLNFWPRISLNIGKGVIIANTELDKLDLKIANVLMSPTMLFNSKMTPLHLLLKSRGGIFDDLSTGEMVNRANLLTRRNLILAMFSHAARYESIRMILPLLGIVTNSVSVMYTIKQEGILDRETGEVNYGGFGSLEIHLDKNFFVIAEVFDKSILRIIVREDSEFLKERGIKTVLSVLRSQGFDGKTNSSEEAGLYIDPNMSKLISIKKAGVIPVLTSSVLRSNIDNLDKVRIEIEEQEDRRTLKMVQEETNATILTLPCNYEMASKLANNELDLEKEIQQLVESERELELIKIRKLATEAELKKIQDAMVIRVTEGMTSKRKKRLKKVETRIGKELEKDSKFDRLLEESRIKRKFEEKFLNLTNPLKDPLNVFMKKWCNGTSISEPEVGLFMRRIKLINEDIVKAENYESTRTIVVKDASEFWDYDFDRLSIDRGAILRAYRTRAGRKEVTSLSKIEWFFRISIEKDDGYVDPTWYDDSLWKFSQEVIKSEIIKLLKKKDRDSVDRYHSKKNMTLAIEKLNNSLKTIEDEKQADEDFEAMFLEEQRKVMEKDGLKEKEKKGKDADLADENDSDDGKFRGETEFLKDDAEAMKTLASLGGVSFLRSLGESVLSDDEEDNLIEAGDSEEYRLSQAFISSGASLDDETAAEVQSVLQNMQLNEEKIKIPRAPLETRKTLVNEIRKISQKIDLDFSSMTWDSSKNKHMRRETAEFFNWLGFKGMSGSKRRDALLSSRGVTKIKDEISTDYGKEIMKTLIDDF